MIYPVGVQWITTPKTNGVRPCLDIKAARPSGVHGVETWVFVPSSFSLIVDMAGSGFESVGTSEGSATTSSYGKACLQCSKSKTRCVPASSGSKCERYKLFNKAFIST